MCPWPWGQQVVEGLRPPSGGRRGPSETAVGARQLPHMHTLGGSSWPPDAGPPQGRGVPSADRASLPVGFVGI